MKLDPLLETRRDRDEWKAWETSKWTPKSSEF